MPRIFRLTNSLGPLESKVMKIVWKNPVITVKNVSEKMNQNLAYTTVMTVLDNLYQKGFVRRKKIGKAYYYSPVSEEKNIIKESLTDTLNSLSVSYGKTKILFRLLLILLPFKIALSLTATGKFLGFGLISSLSLFFISTVQFLENSYFSGFFDHLGLIVRQPAIFFEYFSLHLAVFSENFLTINFFISLLFLLMALFLARQTNRILNLKGEIND